MHTYIILRRGSWSSRSEVERAAGRSSRVNIEELSDRVRWIRSYVLRESNGRFGTICVFQAADRAAAADQARRAGLPCDEIIEVAETVVINDDPLPVA